MEVRIGAGGVHVLDRLGHRVHVVERTAGAWHRSIGRQGGGPGELERPFGLAVPGAEVVVGDGGKASLERFGPDGGHLGSHRLGEVGFGLHALGDGSFLVNSLLGRVGGWKRFVPGEGLVPFAWPDDGRPSSQAAFECSRVGAAAGFVLRLDCYRLTFQVLESDETLVREVSVEGPAEAVNDQRLEPHLERVRQTMTRSGLPDGAVADALERERARFRLNPKMRAIRLDPASGRVGVWEQEPDDLGGGPARLHVFSDSGVYLARVAFSDPWADFDWSGSRLFALTRDPRTGLIRLVAHRLELPDEPS